MASPKTCSAKLLTWANTNNASPKFGATEFQGAVAKKCYKSFNSLANTGWIYITSFVEYVTPNRT